MGNLTENKPKPLLEIAGKTLLEYELDVLPASVDEVIIVVGYLGDMIKNRFGEFFKGKKILYAEQGPMHGTAGALWSARPFIKDRFLVLMADDLYSKEDAARATAYDGWSLGVQQLDEMQTKGRVETNDSGEILLVSEGDHGKTAGLAGTNMFVLDTRIFECQMVPKASGSEEYGLPQTAIVAAQKFGISFRAIPATFWREISSPEDLQKAEKILRNQKK